ncbi:MAG: sigma-70 family RNA polymerase sigma factor, partial [Solirubrobacteraceae bacterium]|nr:sigma-70 family RNA polymerase sigma factor [Solirubrobacteraceae bacterium]
MTVTVQSPFSDISTAASSEVSPDTAADDTVDVVPEPRTPRRTTRRDGDRGLTRAERSEQTAALLTESVTCGDPAERERILERVVLINRGVAEAVASRYRSRGVPQDDLVQAAYEGLTKAVHRFDPLLRNDLLTYAVPTIRGELQRYFRDQGWVVRPPRRVQELQWRVNQTIDRL